MKLLDFISEIMILLLYCLTVPFLKPCPRDLKGHEWDECLLESFGDAYPYLVNGKSNYSKHLTIKYLHLLNLTQTTHTHTHTHTRLYIYIYILFIYLCLGI